MEAGIVRLQNGGTRSLAGKSRPGIALLLLLEMKSARRFCGERGIVVVGHRRRLELSAVDRQRIRPQARSWSPMVRFKVEGQT